MPGSVDVAVIGAGLAGLIAARDVAAAGLGVTVLEARDRVGGRLLNAALPGADGEIVEAGGQWVGPGQDLVLGLIRELGLDTFPTYDTGDKIAELRGGRTQYSGRIPRLNPAVLADIGQGQLRMDRAARRVPLDAPWSAPGAARLDGQTFATWLRRRMGTVRGLAFTRLVTEAVWCAEPEDMSALWALFYLHSGGGVDSLINTTGGAQQDRVTGGSQRIALELAAGLGDQVVTGTPVREIEWDGAGAEVRAPGHQVRARRVVLAVPPPLAARIRYAPGLPPERDQLTQRMPMGWTIKVNVVYDEPFWRAGRLLRAAGQVRGRVPGTRLGGRGVLARLLRRVRHPRHADPLRPGAAHRGGAAALGRHRDRHPLGRVHGRRGAVRPAGRPRGHRGPGPGRGFLISQWCGSGRGTRR
jgi:monoamine oxidase